MSSNLTQSTSITVVASNITNPSIAGTTSAFLIKTIYDMNSGQGTYVDSSSNITLNILPSNMSNLSLSLSNYIVNQNVNITIMINNKNILSAGTIIQVTLPTDFQFTTINCYFGGVSVSCTKINTTTINITGVISSSFASGQLNSSSYAIILSNIVNPISFKPTGSYTISLLTSTFVVI
jgi:hypothetical protein